MPVKPMLLEMHVMVMSLPPLPQALTPLARSHSMHSGGGLVVPVALVALALCLFGDSSEQK